MHQSLGLTPTRRLLKSLVFTCGINQSYIGVAAISFQFNYQYRFHRRPSWPALNPHSTESKTAERPLKDHETCLIYQWSFNELSMISEVFHDSWLIFQWSLWSPWSPKLFETVQNSLSAVFQENGLSAVFQRSLNELSKVLLVFPWSFDSLCYLVLSESLQQSRSVFQSSLGGLGQSFRVLSKISGSMPDDLLVISQ